MDQQELTERFATLTTAHLADACIRAAAPVRCAPAAVRPFLAGGKVAGRVAPARHVGSVDLFLEVLERHAEPGDVLVVDNGGRLDEACVGDLVALEVARAGLGGVVIWGLHRDSADLRAIGLPVFSLGALPTGPQRLDPRHAEAVASAVVGDWRVDRSDLVFGDEDGVLFLPADRAEELLALAESIRDTERRQAERIHGGTSLRAQLGFAAYLAERDRNPAHTFRDHLRGIGGAIEE
ncbi:RraA family protein [Kitasatospora viridis]|uniref:Putative 4-hydroxy-4-methyl-2-oxoglutarate aldolase n=1 Tax=Kitasatospora viridis TaxID=281105 RepID=A0A561UBP3_9ACTN|nr:RraA family protein [Kitasatospora viridis]TWF96778.1 regulator of RNase E activity RraA [Kitasatospora viridis]